MNQSEPGSKLEKTRRERKNKERDRERGKDARER